MILKRKFYYRNTVRVAKDLLGCFLVREYRGKIIKARIIETEAYRGEYDLACHASKGRTPRTETLYGEPGHAYVYMIYGMYFLLNVVAEERDFPGGVLIRGIEIVEGNDYCPIRGENFRPLQISGPGKLTRFLHIDKSLNNHDLTVGKKLWVETPFGHPMSKAGLKHIRTSDVPKFGKQFKIKRSPRVGIDYAKHCRAWKWNFKIANLCE